MSNPDFAAMLNPYQFSHPVMKPERFFGRKKILEEVTYYLDQAETAPKPMNLALIGPRASGKTSLLNLIGAEAKERGFCVVHVPLNEDDAKSDVAFFFKLFDSVFQSALNYPAKESNDLPPFGGEWGDTHYAYLNLVTTGTSTNPRLCPFRFAHFYALSQKSANEPLVNDSMIRQDLELISKEVERPIVVLFDEANVLSLRPALLQKLRNIFQATTGYMLILAGTESLFDSIDDVFSPIARDFKRVEVGPFENREEAEECILTPLKLAGLTPPTHYISREALFDLTHPGGFTDGMPYQIQLACHFLFRGMQKAGKRPMQLSIEIINQVLREISGGNNELETPILDTYRSLDRSEITRLHRLLQGSAAESLEYRLAIRRILLGEAESELLEIRRSFDRFLDLGLIKGDKDQYSFAGDDRESLYAKYLGKALGVREFISQVPVRARGIHEFVAKLQKETGWIPFADLPFLGSRTYEANAQKLVDTIRDMSNTVVSDDSLLTSILAGLPAVDVLHFLMKVFDSNTTNLATALITIESPMFSQSFIVHRIGPEAINDKDLDEFITAYSDAIQLGSDEQITHRVVSVVLPPLDALMDIIRSKIVSDSFSAIFALHEAAKEYLSHGLSEKCLMLLNLLQDHHESLDVEVRNNLGYMIMAKQQWSEALLIFNTIDAEQEANELSLYNSAICALMNSDYDSAFLFTERSLETARMNSEQMIAERLFLASISNDELSLREDTDVSVYNCATSLQQLISDNFLKAD